MLLIVTENGYGLLVENMYTVRHRGKKGNKSIVTNDRNGNVVAVRQVKKMTQKIVVVSATGQLAVFPVKEMRVLSSNSQGVKVIDLEKDDVLVDVLVV